MILNNEMKDVMSERDVENFEGKVKTFFDANNYQKDYEAAVRYAKRYGGVVYTMVDSDDGKHTVYEKGLHFVNRFGFAVLIGK